ncbi:MAG TPA: GIY-YIG nuclease family protein [Candidatus Saccharimonadales bacterium]
MYYLYLLYSKKLKEFYIGTTPDLRRRFYTHNAGKNIATKNGAPWRLVYYEAYPTKENALNREYKLKRYGQALRQLKARITLVDPR